MTLSLNEIKCIKCGEPLLYDAESVDSFFNAHYNIHYKCMICTYCNDPITEQVLESASTSNPRPPSHSHCYSNHMQAEINKRPITITQGELDYLNNSRFARPDKKMTIEENVKIFETHAKAYVKDFGVEELYIHLKQMQSWTAAVSILLRNDRVALNNKLDLELKTASRKRELDKHNATMESVEEYRLSEARAKELKSEKKSPDWKAIQGLMKVGMSESEAREQLKAMKERNAK